MWQYFSLNFKLLSLILYNAIEKFNQYSQYVRIRSSVGNHKLVFNFLISSKNKVLKIQITFQFIIEKSTSIFPENILSCEK